MLEHPEAERADPYEKDVERVWRDSGKVYGARKIRHALGHEGVTLYRRRINRIMKGNGMAGSYSKAAYRPRPARPNDDPAPNILAREFNGYAPRTHLASDPAYVRVGASWSYVCLPGGLANRQIAGHSVEVGHDTDLVLAAFAAPRFPLTDIQVLRTDRGGGFAGERMERMLAEFGITRSLSRPGSPYDNAVVESTDRLIRKELMYDNVCTSVERLRSDLNRYVWWYDHQRLHSTLGYMNPVEFTQQGVFSQVGVSCFVTDFFFTAEKHCRTRPTNIEAIHFLFASLLRILYFTCAKRWNSAKILFAWYLLGWVAKRGCGTILSGGALWRRAFLANRGKETGP